MNELITRAARRSRAGVLGSGVHRLAEDRRELLHAAMADAELAIKHGDDTGRAMAEERIDKILDEARQARTAPQGATQEPKPTSTGGVRRPVVRSKPESFTTTIRRAVAERNALAAAARDSV